MTLTDIIDHADIDPHRGPAWLRNMREVSGVDQLDRVQAREFILQNWPYLIGTEEIPWDILVLTWALAKARIRPPFSQVPVDELFTQPATWRKWGFDIKSCERGAIACLEDRVGLCCGQIDNDNVQLMGGYEPNIVGVRPAALTDILAYRWPSPEDYRTGYYPDDDRK